jgi:hypothetical protein
MAKTMSPMFLGKTIEGVWHTGLVVYDKEYFYGGGICVGVPKVRIHFIIILIVHSLWHSSKRNCST